MNHCSRPISPAPHSVNLHKAPRRKRTLSRRRQFVKITTPKDVPGHHASGNTSVLLAAAHILRQSANPTLRHRPQGQTKSKPDYMVIPLRDTWAHSPLYIQEQGSILHFVPLTYHILASIVGRFILISYILGHGTILPFVPHTHHALTSIVGTYILISYIPGQGSILPFVPLIHYILASIVGIFIFISFSLGQSSILPFIPHFQCSLTTIVRTYILISRTSPLAL